MTRLERAIADFAWHFRTTPPGHQSPFDMQVEYTQNLWDFANRLAGGAISGRRHVRPFRELVVVGDAIGVTTRVPVFKQGRKAAISRATENLQKAFLACADTARPFSQHLSRSESQPTSVHLSKITKKTNNDVRSRKTPGFPTVIVLPVPSRTTDHGVLLATGF